MTRSLDRTCTACHCGSAHDTTGRSSGRATTRATREYLRALGDVADHVDPERIARLQRAGVPPQVATSILTQT